MFDIMIIDDDMQIRERLKSLIDWKNLPIRLVCEAADSETAEELYLIHRPKIIITDISIPIISGLDLAEKLQKEDPSLQFIVITGFNDFDFVRKSVNIGAIDLLSKPIFPDALNGSLRKAVAYFQKMQEEKSSVAFLQHLVSKNLPQMQEAFLASLICNPPDPKVDFQAQFQQLKIPCVGPYYAVLMLAIQSPSQSSVTPEATLLLLRDALSTSFSSAGYQIVFYLDPHSRLNCLVGSSIPCPDNDIEEIVARTHEQLLFLSGSKIFTGIGPTVKQLNQLYESRSGALTALNYQCVLGSDSIMHFKNMDRMGTIFHMQEDIQSYLLQMFRENNYDALSITLSNHITILSRRGGRQEQAIQHFLFEYVQSITNEALRLGLTTERMEAYLPTIVQLLQRNDPQKQLEHTLRLTEQLMKSLSQRHTSESNHLIHMAKEYIAQNLGNESLCLESVSDHVGLSRIYFCKLFHQVENISFSNYLKGERINKSKYLLRNTNMKIFEISDAVGFSNAKYFSFAFKQVVGLTPGDYQKLPRE